MADYDAAKEIAKRIHKGTVAAPEKWSEIIDRAAKLIHEYAAELEAEIELLKNAYHEATETIEELEGQIAELGEYNG